MASEGLMIEALMRNTLTRLGHLAGFLVISTMMVACPARADKIRHPIAVFSGLDKITGRTIAFQAATGETVQFGTLQITERACYTRPATEAPQTTTFVEVDLQPPATPEAPQTPAQEPSPPRKGHSNKKRTPVAKAPLDAPPQEQQDAEPSPMDAPIEVGRPPGLIPAPQGNR
jgi:hypothetical protein